MQEGRNGNRMWWSKVKLYSSSLKGFRDKLTQGELGSRVDIARGRGRAANKSSVGSGEVQRGKAQWSIGNLHEPGRHARSNLFVTITWRECLRALPPGERDRLFC